MKCLRCGTTISSDQFFCDPCQENMERHPVKPGTPIVLPNRPQRQVVAKSGRRRTRKPEEQIARLRMTVFWLILLIMVLATAVFVVTVLLLDAREALNQAAAAYVAHSII